MTMKKIIIFSIALIMSFLAQAQLYNNGAVLSIATGGILQVNAAFTNKSGSNLVNNGSLNLKGNLTNEQTMSAANNGTLTLEGTSAQTISGTAVYLAKNVTFNNAAGMTISKSLKADGEVKFQSGLITASNNSEPMIFGSNGIVSTMNVPNNTSHVNGFVKKEGTGALTFPIGDGTRYQPVGVNLTSNTDGIAAKYNVGSAGAGTYTTTGASNIALVSHNNLEYWDLTPISTAAGTVTVHWDDYNIIYLNVINDITDLAVAHKSGSNWLNEGGTATGSTTSGSITSLAINTWSPFALGSINARTILPITWLSFTGKAEEDYNLLTWTTASENQNKGFDIERSADGVRFEKIGFVTGKGTTSTKQDYRFKDESPNGLVYYRLKQLDFDGRFEYSKIIAIDRKGENVMSVFPNPSKGIFTITGIKNLEDETFTLINNVGQTLSINVQNDGQMDMSAFPSGVYYLRVASNGQVMKLVKE